MAVPYRGAVVALVDLAHGAVCVAVAFELLVAAVYVDGFLVVFQGVGVKFSPEAIVALLAFLHQLLFCILCLHGDWD